MPRTPLKDRAEIERLIRQHGRWWHEIEVAPGIITPGDDSNRMKLPILDSIGLPRSMEGLRALDVGCSDGFFSFEMEKRGASVVAIDFVPEDYTGFAVAKEILGSSVEYRMENVYNLEPERFGTFDVVLFLGVLYHLRNPLGGLDAIRSVMNDGGQLFVGTMMIDEYFQLPDRSVTSLEALDPVLGEVPLWQAYPRDSLNGDFTNCFAPNRAALVAALGEAQFSAEQVVTVSMGGYARAVAVSDPLIEKYQRLDGRLQKTPFDPAVPYFLDEEGSVHEVTGHRAINAVAPAPAERKPWWRFWRDG
jgi:tRNA (mo5U34)-methyltransferase